MARKRKKSRKRTRTPRLSEAQLVQPTPTVRTVTAADRQTPDDEPVDLREEYWYVAADLKRIAIIAAAMMVVMIGLALVAI